MCVSFIKIGQVVPENWVLKVVKVYKIYIIYRLVTINCKTCVTWTHTQQV